MEVLFTFISQHFILGLDADFLSIIGSILIVTSCVGVALAKEINDDNDVDEHSDDDNEELALLDEWNTCRKELWEFIGQLVSWNSHHQDEIYWLSFFSVVLAEG